MTDKYTFLSNGIFYSYSYGNAGTYAEVASISVANDATDSNASMNTSSISIANSSASIVIALPTAAQIATGAYYLNANGAWVTVSGGGSGSINTLAQYIFSNSITFLATATFGNSTVFTTTNGTSFSGTANNTLYVGSTLAANIVTDAQLTANIQYFVNTSTLASDLSVYQTTSGLASNVATLGYQTTIGLASNIATLGYQTTAGLAGNVGTLTANDTMYVGTTSAANVVSNAQLAANLSGYQTTAGLAGNVATLAANDAAFIGSLPAANVVSNAQLIANLTNYQTTAGLAANVVTLSANDASYLGGIAASGYANTTNPIVSNNLTTNAVTITGLIYLDGSYGNNGQAIISGGGGTPAAWGNVTGGGAGASPGGSNTQVQYNNSGSFAASASLEFNYTSNVLTVSDGTGNAFTVNSTGISQGNSSTNTVITSSTYQSGNSTIYTFANSTADVWVGATGNSTISAASLTIRDSTDVYTINSIALTMSNNSSNNNVYLGFVAGSYYGLILNGLGLANSAANYNIISAPNDYNLYINRPAGSQIQFKEGNANIEMTIAAGGNVSIAASLSVNNYISGTILTVSQPYITANNSTYLNGQATAALNVNSATYATQLLIGGTATTFNWSAPYAVPTWIWGGYAPSGQVNEMYVFSPSNLNVNSASYAIDLMISGTATTFNWSGTAGQPSWLWGGNSLGSMVVWNPSNFNVNSASYASSAGSAPAITGAGAVGTYVVGSGTGLSPGAGLGTNIAASSMLVYYWNSATSHNVLSGTWQFMGATLASATTFGHWQRIA